ncbi:unnamed protein product, partial [Phaeothamnion confervicola]
MGSALAKQSDKAFAARPENPCAWNASHVTSLHDVYKRGNHDWAITRIELEAMISEFAPESLGKGFEETLWGAIGKSKTQETLFSLEAFLFLAFVCRGTIRDKASLAFGFVDFDGEGMATYDEIALLLLTAIAVLPAAAAFVAAAAPHTPPPER